MRQTQGHTKPSPRESKSLQAAITAFLESAEDRNCAELTRKSYKVELGRFAEFASSNRAKNIRFVQNVNFLPISSIERSCLNAFLRSRNAGMSTKARIVTLLKAFFSFCVRQEWIERSPAELLEVPRWEVCERVPYTAEEALAILNACQTPSERALIQLMRHTGLRVSDAVACQVSQLRDGCAWIRAKKNGREVPIVLPCEVLHELRALNAGTWLFGNGRPPSLSAWHHTLDRIYRDSGVANAMNHRWRHTLASHLAAKGVPIRMIAKILGISEATAEKHYAKYTPEETEQLKAVLARVV